MGDKLMLCQSGNCAPVSTTLLRYLVQEQLENEYDELMDTPERRSSYLFRSRRMDPKRSSAYLWRTRKAFLEPRDTRGEYLFRTRKSDAAMDRMLRSSKSYLFRTR